MNKSRCNTCEGGMREYPEDCEARHLADVIRSTLDIEC